MKSKVFSVFIITVFLFACEVEEENNNDINDNHNMVYVGGWNFKGNGVSYSGYYTYDSLLNSEWVSNVTYTTNYNDSTGSIQLGNNINELIFKYCSSCEPVVYDLNNNGEQQWSEGNGNYTGWTLTDSTFFRVVTPPPPSYSDSYTTYDIEGWKL